jgi:hypothetical protein
MQIVVTPNADRLRQQMLGGGPDQPPVLLNHPTQSATAIDGWKSVLFGLPFLAAGVMIGFVALDAMPARKHAPDWLIGLIACFFFLAGAFLVIHGLRGAARKAAHDREAAAQPGQPWLADHHWQREGSSFSALNEMLRRFVAAIFWNAFLIPFFWVGLNQRGVGRVFLGGAVLFALIGLIFWSRWIQMLADFFRYGNSTLLFDSFPYFLGSQLNGRLRAPRHFDVIDELTLTLRCVQEKYVTTGAGSSRSTQVVCYELYKDVATFSHSQLAGAASSYLPISFRVPEDQPITHLSDTPPTYWEIEARGKARGADYEAYFLVPVYKAP